MEEYLIKIKKGAAKTDQGMKGDLKNKKFEKFPNGWFYIEKYRKNPLYICQTGGKVFLEPHSGAV